jgi:hypothetical protein
MLEQVEPKFRHGVLTLLIGELESNKPDDQRCEHLAARLNDKPERTTHDATSLVAASAAADASKLIFGGRSDIAL